MEKEKDKKVFTKTIRIMTTLLSVSALLVLAIGCSSSSDKQQRMTESRHNTMVVASHQEPYSYDNQRTYSSSNDQQYRSSNSDNYRTIQVSETTAQARSEPIYIGNGPQYAHAYATSSNETGIQTAAEQRDRVSYVSAEKPPLTLAETPSHTPGTDEFWVGGHWVAGSNGFTWKPGYIERNRPGMLFVGGGWAAAPNGGWEFTPAYWR